MNRVYKKEAHESCNDTHVLCSMRSDRHYFATAEGITKSYLAPCRFVKRWLIGAVA